jgi:hypothetical protein
MTRVVFGRSIIIGCILLAAGLGLPRRAAAEDRVGGHFGALFPLVSRSAGETTTIADDFVVGFPTGITVKMNDGWAFDLELVPVIQNKPLFVSMTLHPGIIHSLPDAMAAGVRMAFDVNQPSWGFTPLLNRAFPVPGHNYAYFVEGVVPIRFQQTPAGDNRTSVGLAVHVGVAF